LLFPGLTGGGRVVDFGDAKILNAMFRIFNDNVRHKTVNPEFAFYARAEMGLYNLLHLLRAKVDTSAILEKSMPMLNRGGSARRGFESRLGSSQALNRGRGSLQSAGPGACR
jgi:hypothetical protein